LELALVGIADAENDRAGATRTFPPNIRSAACRGVTLLLDSAQRTAAIPTDVLGFREIAREESVIRFAAAGDVKGNVVDIYEAPGVLRGQQGRGSVHHIAFRAANGPFLRKRRRDERVHFPLRDAADQDPGPADSRSELMNLQVQH